MEIILSNHCKSLTGSFVRGFGYHVQRRKNGFFAKRNSKGIIPPDGHWRFITTCAELAQNGLHIADIRVSHPELSEALSEAGLPLSGAPNENSESLLSGAPGVRPEKIYSASDILILKERISL